MATENQGNWYSKRYKRNENTILTLLVLLLESILEIAQENGGQDYQEQLKYGTKKHNLL